ncbi:MAG TPA: hypothetical protein VGL49_00815 [Acidimicrobiales bacterium]|jgi:hypothetical protein
MHNFDVGPEQYSGYGEPEPDAPRKHSTFSLIAMIVVVAVVGVAALGLIFWALGFLFSLAGVILKVAILAAVAAFVWRRCSHRWSRDRV